MHRRLDGRARREPPNKSRVGDIVVSEAMTDDPTLLALVGRRAPIAEGALAKDVSPETGRQLSANWLTDRLVRRRETRGRSRPCWSRAAQLRLPISGR